MVIPATNAVSERSASALRRVKTYLQEFVDCRERRTDVFGKFK